MYEGGGGVEVEDDAGIGAPYDVKHELHVESDDLACLPAEWVAQLRVRATSCPLFHHLLRPLFFLP